MPSAVVYEKRAAVGIVSLNRPQVLNAYNVAMRDELYEALTAIRDDPEVRVVILRGNGPSFCSGGDLSEFGSAPSPVIGRQARWQRDVWGLLYGLPKPTIAAVHGYAVGSGLEMALLCDICIAAEDAVFGYPETGRGMIPGATGTQTTPRLVGVSRALDLMLTGRQLTAHEAVAMGLVSRLASKGAHFETAMTLAQSMIPIEPNLVANLKRVIAEGLDLPLQAGLALEATLTYEPRATSHEPRPQ